MKPTTESTHPKISAAFRDLLPVVDAEADAGLEASIAAEGCRDALVVWKERGVLVDGHRRLAVCKRLGKTYRVVARSFASEAAALAWARANQRDRRNLSPDQIGYLRGLEYEAQKGEHGGSRPSHQNGDLVEKTSVRLAGAAGVSKNTIERDAAFARNVNAIAEVAPETKAKLLDGSVSRTKTAAVAAVVRDNPRLAPAAVEEMLTAPRPKPETRSNGNGSAAESTPADRWLTVYREARERVSDAVGSARRLGVAAIVAKWGTGDRKNALIEWRLLAKWLNELVEELEAMQP